MLKRNLVILATALGFLNAADAGAQSWQAIGSSISGDKFEIDVSSIKKEGPYVSSWSRLTLEHDLRLPNLMRHYHSSMSQHLDDCANATVGVTNTQFMDHDSRIIQSQNFPISQIQFAPVIPGSVSQLLQRFVCDRIARQSRLKPYLNVTPKTDKNWQSVGYEVVNRIQWYYDPTSVAWKGDIVSYIVKSEGDGTQHLADGTAYRTFFALDLMDCKNHIFGVPVNEAYNDSGEIIYTWSSVPDNFKLDQPVAPGSVAENISKIVCQSRGTDNSNDNSAKAASPPISTGTAWLGPKGYLITANHVVTGATVLGLAQNGKVIGTADVVVTDPANDIAILRPNFADGPHTSIALRRSPARLGERAFTLGYPAPDALGLSIKMTTGVVSATAGSDGGEGRKDDPRILQISVPVQSGNSGGPLFDDAGYAIGLVVAKQLKISETEVAQNVNYATKIAYVETLLSELPDIGERKIQMQGSGITNIVANLKGSVFLIIASSNEIGK